MKRYNSPMTAIQPLNYSSVLCASGSSEAPVRSNINVQGGDQSGNQADAF
jgi:hypothetical protein